MPNHITWNRPNLFCTSVSPTAEDIVNHPVTEFPIHPVHEITLHNDGIQRISYSRVYCICIGVLLLLFLILFLNFQKIITRWISEINQLMREFIINRWRSYHTAHTKNYINRQRYSIPKPINVVYPYEYRISKASPSLSYKTLRTKNIILSNIIHRDYPSYSKIILCTPGLQNFKYLLMS